MRNLSPSRIAALRTAAPLLWAGILSLLLERGFDLHARLVDWTGLPDALVAAGAPLVLTFVLWVVALVAPWSWVEAILLLVRVDGYRYEQNGQLVTDSARVDVADLPALSAGSRSDDFVAASIDAVLRRRPDARVLEMAAARLDDEIRLLRADPEGD